MAIIRWSDKSDLYVYYHVDDFWSVNVAGRRKALPGESAEEDGYRTIGGPHDGESFALETPEEVLHLAHQLEAAGYTVPAEFYVRMEQEV